MESAMQDGTLLAFLFWLIAALSCLGGVLMVWFFALLIRATWSLSASVNALHRALGENQ